MDNNIIIVHLIVTVFSSNSTPKKYIFSFLLFSFILSAKVPDSHLNILLKQAS